MKKLCVALVLMYAPFAHAAYKCVDERGLTLIGDVPPAGCANVVMYEISASGTVLRKIDPTPTAEQVKAKLEEQQKKREADRAAFEQKRKDMALLNTYSSEKEIDVARDRNIEPIRGRIEASKERMAAVDKHLKEIADQKEFYKAGHKATKDKPAPEVPQGLVMQEESALKEKASLEKSIADNEKEIVAVRARYEADRKRYAELKGDVALRTAQQAPEAPGLAGTLSAGAAGTATCGGKVYACQAGTAYICRIGYKTTPVNCVVDRK
jgi:hypothetical protein